MKDYSKKFLSNGLKVVTVPIPKAKSVTAMVLVGAGSRYETPQTNGLSHFLEHMVFKGSQKWPTAKEIASLVDGIGGDFNAYTDKENTIYYIKAASSYLELVLEVLSDITFNPLFLSNEIEKEKGVIVEEIKMYEDLPMRRVAEYFENLLYPKSPLGWDIGGTEKVIRGIKREDFLSYRQKRYVLENMLVVIAGGFSQKEGQTQVEKYFANYQSKGQVGKPNEKFIQKKPGLLLKSKKTDQAHLICGVRGNELGHQDRYVEAVLATILGGGMSSRLFTEVREKRGLAYYVRTENEHYLDNGYLATSAGVDIKRIDEAIKVILEEYAKIKKAKDVSPEELKKAKACLKGKFILDMEDSRNLGQHFGLDELLEGKGRSIEEVLRGIDQVSLADINRVANEFFKEERLNLAIIGPFEDDFEFAKLLHC